MSARTSVESFVVRFTSEMDDGASVRWRGHIEHVQSQQAQYFVEMQTAVEFMQSVLATVPHPSTHTTRAGRGGTTVAQAGRKRRGNDRPNKPGVR